MTQLKHSGKLLLLFEILHQSELVVDKVLIFSQSLVSLCLVEEFLAAEDRTNRAGLAHTDVSFNSVVQYVSQHLGLCSIIFFCFTYTGEPCWNYGDYILTIL